MANQERTGLSNPEHRTSWWKSINWMKRLFPSGWPGTYASRHEVASRIRGERRLAEGEGRV